MAKKKVKKAVAYRDSQISIVMGSTGTGKSYLTNQVLKKIGYKKVLIITMTGMPKIWREHKEIDASKKESYNFTGFRQIMYARHDKKTFDYIHKYFRNGVLVLDDCRNYLPAALDHLQALRNIVIDHRHLMTDMFFICHAPSDVPPKIWAFARTYFIGATQSLIPKSMGLEAKEEILAAQREVNKAFKAARARNDGSHYGIFKVIQV